MLIHQLPAILTWLALAIHTQVLPALALPSSSNNSILSAVQCNGVCQSLTLLSCLLVSHPRQSAPFSSLNTCDSLAYCIVLRHSFSLGLSCFLFSGTITFEFQFVLLCYSSVLCLILIPTMASSCAALMCSWSVKQPVVLAGLPAVRAVCIQYLRTLMPWFRLGGNSIYASAVHLLTTVTVAVRTGTIFFLSPSFHFSCFSIVSCTRHHFPFFTFIHKFLSFRFFQMTGMHFWPWILDICFMCLALLCLSFGVVLLCCYALCSPVLCLCFCLSVSRLVSYNLQTRHAKVQ